MNHSDFNLAVVEILEFNVEIEFYVSFDNKTMGMSRSALAKLCGVSEKAISLISETNNCPLFLKDFENNFYLCTDIINSSAAAAIIEYYAFESKASNDIAKKSFRAFARIGIDIWIKQLTNSDVVQKIEELKSMMSLLVEDIQEVKTEVKNFRRTISIYSKNSDRVNNLKKLTNRCFTISDYFNTLKLDVNNSQYRKIRLQVAQTYKNITNEEPERKRIYTKTKEGNRSHSWEMVYRPEDLPMIEEITRKTLA